MKRIIYIYIYTSHLNQNYKTLYYLYVDNIIKLTDFIIPDSVLPIILYLKFGKGCILTDTSISLKMGPISYVLPFDIK